MSVWADSGHPAWIQTTGDNIYQEGIYSWDDRQVDTKWRNIYKQPSLRNLVWHMALGNHDYGVLLANEWNQVTVLHYLLKLTPATPPVPSFLLFERFSAILV